MIKRDNAISCAVLDLEAELDRLKKRIVEGEHVGRLFACMSSVEQAEALEYAWDELASESAHKRETQMSYLAQDVKRNDDALLFVRELVAFLRLEGVVFE